MIELLFVGTVIVLGGVWTLRRAVKSDIKIDLSDLTPKSAAPCGSQPMSPEERARKQRGDINKL